MQNSSRINALNVFAWALEPLGMLAYFAAFGEMFMPHSQDYTLDLCGLACPLPLLKVKKQLAQMTSGEDLRVVVTDPGAQEDFLLYARQRNDLVLSRSWQEDLHYYFIFELR